MGTCIRHKKVKRVQLTEKEVRFRKYLFFVDLIEKNPAKMDDERRHVTRKFRQHLHKALIC